MSEHKHLTYEELKNLKKDTIIMYRDQFKNYQWRMGTFLGHFSAYGSAAMKFSYHEDNKENEGWTTVFTGLQFYDGVWTNEFKMWRNYRWPTENDLNEELLEKMGVEK